MGRGGENNPDPSALLYGRWKLPPRPEIPKTWREATDIWADVESNGQDVHRLETEDFELLYWMNNDRFAIEYKLFRDGLEHDSGSIFLPGEPLSIHDMTELPDGRLLASWESGYRKEAFALVDVAPGGQTRIDEPTEYDPMEEKQILFRGEPMLISTDGDRFLLRRSAGGDLQAIRTSELPDGVVCKELLGAGQGDEGSEILIWNASDPEGFVVLREDPLSPDTTFRVEHRIPGESFSSLVSFMPGRDGYPPAVIARDEDGGIFISDPERGRVEIRSEAPTPPIVLTERAGDGSVLVQWQKQSGSRLVRIPPEGDPEVLDFDRDRDQVQATISGEKINLFWLEDEDGIQALKTNSLPLEEIASAATTPGETIDRSRVLENLIYIDGGYVDSEGQSGVIWTEGKEDLNDFDPSFSVRRSVRK